MSERAFVTGVAGLLGQHIARQLLAQGSQVRGLVREASQRAWLPPDVELVVGDVRDRGLLVRAAKGCRFLFHTCCTHAYGLPAKEISAINVLGTENACHAALLAGCERLVFTSTLSTLSGRWEDEHPHKDSPRFLSTLTKKQAEDLVMDLVANERLPAIVVNPAYFIGPFDHHPSPFRLITPWVLARPVPAVPAGGFNVLSAREVAAKHLEFRQVGQPGERYAVTGYDISLRDYVSLVARMAGRSSSPRVLSAPQTRRLFRLLRFAGFSTADEYVAQLLCHKSQIGDADPAVRLRLEEAVRDTVEWFLTTGTLQGLGQFLAYSWRRFS